MTGVLYASTLDAVLLAIAVSCVAYALAIFTVLARWHIRERQRRAERERRRMAQREQLDKDRRQLRLRVNAAASSGEAQTSHKETIQSVLSQSSSASPQSASSSDTTTPRRAPTLVTPGTTRTVTAT